MEENKYLIQRRNRKKQWLRLRLGVLQLINKPVLNILWVVIGISIVLIIIGKEKLVRYLDVPQILIPVFNLTMNIVIVLIPIILILFMIESIGELSARKDEADLQEAFGKKALRNGCPILMNKKRDKNTNVIMREFYSSIPYNTWIENMDAIADSMNVHFVEKIQYGGRADGKRIVIYTATGRKPIERDELYDEEF
ncbi:hypothetical protein QTI76_08560 [Clostridium perfringens]|nr:hypothetical protein [Clostridium perfringens]